MIITAEDPLTEESRVLIDGSEAALREVYPPEECFSFTAEELAKPEITFYVARNDTGMPLGCVASCDYGDYAEVKRLFVPPAGRGQGTAKALMDHLEATARDEGKTHVRLETGDKLAAAVALYAARGYIRRGPFGDYSAHPSSTFMEKSL